MRELERRSPDGVQQNLVGALCYVMGWVSGIVFLIAAGKNSFIRYHAFQSIFTFGGITLAAVILALIPFVGSILAWSILVLAAIPWILMMVKAGQGQWYKLPLAGKLVEKQIKPASTNLFC